MYFTKHMGKPTLTHGHKHNKKAVASSGVAVASLGVAAAETTGPGNVNATGSFKATANATKASDKHRGGAMSQNSAQQEHASSAAALTAAAQHAPIVFLHGVGCGFLLYIDFLRRLAALGEYVGLVLL